MKIGKEGVEGGELKEMIEVKGNIKIDGKMDVEEKEGGR